MSKTNWSLGQCSSNALRVIDLVGVDLVAVAEDLVEGQQRRGHAAAAAEEVAAGPALPLRGALADLASRSSYSFCSADCGGGTNSSFEAIREGIGGRKSDSASRSH